MDLLRHGEASRRSRHRGRVGRFPAHVRDAALSRRPQRLACVWPVARCGRTSGARRVARAQRAAPRGRALRTGDPGDRRRVRETLRPGSGTPGTIRCLCDASVRGNMFGKLFGKSEPKKPATKEPALEAMVKAIQQQKQADPFIGAKIAGKEILGRLMNAFKDERGVHSESLCCALGALAGYACQASLRAQSIAKGLDPDAGFSIATGKDGRKYYFGDPLKKQVAEVKDSVWSMAAGAVQAAGATQMPDLEGIFKHVAATVGGEGFGQPRYTDKNTAGELPTNYLTSRWR